MVIARETGGRLGFCVEKALDNHSAGACAQAASALHPKQRVCWGNGTWDHPGISPSPTPGQVRRAIAGCFAVALGKAQGGTLFNVVVRTKLAAPAAVQWRAVV